MIAIASGRPMPNELPMINAIAKSKPTPARNSCHDMLLLLEALVKNDLSRRLYDMHGQRQTRGYL
jgi:hypothetical protein